MPEVKTGAVRSPDLDHERWDLISYSSVGSLAQGMRDFNHFHLPTSELIGEAAYHIGKFLGGESYKELSLAWAYIAVAIQGIDSGMAAYDIWVTTNIARDSTNPDEIPPYGLIPYHALQRLAATTHEGAEKYGDNDWLKGFPVTLLLNHSLAHLFKFLNDDKTEDHLGHASWGIMASLHMIAYRPDMCKDLLGPDYTVRKF